ncbi:MAG: methylated-DNA--[protein]-cysteine S-methyltransferase [Acidimicrobiales bacterium]
MTAPTTAITITTTVASPVGPLTLRASDGRLTGMAMEGQRHAPVAGPDQQQDDRWFAAIVEQLDGYFTGELTRFDVPLELSGTEFQRQVWSELQRIPYGETISYGELAHRVGNPAAVRAVGLANGRNPITIIVPCHRVIGADGSLTGYGGGLERKAWLLDHEAGCRAPAA